ncbi:gamma-glutamyltransferase family protein [Microlunatus sp. Gsoil 973]|uniref:gamma-glutamyltransferase family protein n=1 Tax=Microlunatus sp. Gsoil 973 TaxID=2672569 RepID=UPI0012B48369|nr:gamma-glutamyltransferase [Microlunatus sp. Gsoil 973]QGN31857.1 gamma-glutamyltransferase family protein [Microlunatus sp. Gsoil 973]
MFTTRPELAGTFGMVTSTHWLASQSGMAVLEAGGNAFDAAVATGFVLQVVEPHLNGPGGDLPLILKRVDHEPEVLCGQGGAPAGATIEHFRDLGLATVPGTGLLAAAVPGSSVAWLTLLRDHGTMWPADILKYAIHYAESGHPVVERVAALISKMADYFRTYWPTSAQTWLPAPRPGQLQTNPVLARTYSRLVQESQRADTREAACDRAIRAWSEGFVAEAIDAFAKRPMMDSSGTEHTGVITGSDLANWRPSYEQPMSLSWRDNTIYKAAGWAQSPVFLETLAIMDPLLDARFGSDKNWKGFGADQIHLVVEAQKLAFADRDAWFGDAPDHQDLAGLLDPAYLASRRSLISETASLDLRPGRLNGLDPRLPDLSVVTAPVEDASSGEPTVQRDGRTKGDTCHMDVVDRWGNVVSATPSGGWLHSSPTVPDLGFCLGTRLQMVWLEPGLPSSLVPGRRPRTTLSPGMAVAQDGTVTGFGTPGGDQQDQWAMVFWLAHTLGGMNLQAAIDQPTFNIKSMISSFEPRVPEPGVVEVEGRFGADVIADLQRRGHTVTVTGDWSLSRMTAASYDPNTGVLKAGANPRGMQGYAVGR